MSSPVLLDLGATAFSHQSEVNEVKQQLGITHPYFDCWIYGFLENKSFNIAETVAKLRRRADFERNVLSQADITDWMVENMQKGIIQVIGNDKDGRVALYVTTSRDKPKSIRRAESKKNFDMFVSYATRLRAESKRCQLAMLINQEGASMWSNMDMTFQADIALHIAKFYPGCVDKMYICKMNRTLAAMAKPIFSRLPSIVSDRIIIISDGDMKRGKLLELFDENVLPIALGGQNDCDKEENYTRFSNTIKDYFNELRAAICRGESVKEWELGKLRAAGLIEPPKTMDGLRRSIVAMDRSKSSYHGGASSSAPLSPSFRDMRVNYSSSEDDEGVEPNLLTCESLRGYDDLDRVGSVGASLHVRCAEQSLLSDYLSQFLSIETFFRLNLTEVHEREWTHLLRLEMEERKAVHHREQTYSGDRLLTRMPSAARHAIHSFLTLTRLVMSFFFLLGTLFIATLGGLSVTYIFFAMFSKPYNFFLYGLAFIAVMGNFTLFCCRGYELTHSAFRGKVLHVLSAFGTRALIFQVAIYSIGTVSYFIVFCIMAARHDVFTGLQYCASIGWIVAVCLTFIYHVLYALGFRSLTPAASHPHRSGDRPEATMYLFMNLDIEDETQMTKGSEVMTIVVLGVLSFASGVAFMAGGGVFFIVATVLLQTLVLLCSCVFLSASKYTAVASAVIMFCALYVSLFWLSVVFTMTTYGWNDGYGGSLITSLVVSLIFCTTGLLSLFGPWSTTVRTWLFRVLWLMILIQAVGALIALMVNNYRMGLFALALGIHFLLCSVRANSSFNSFGILFVALAFLIFVLSCCIEGHANAAQLYATPASRTLLPDYHTTMSDANISHSMRAPGGLPPICQLHYPDRKMDTTGMALFAKLGYNTDPLTQAIDLARWFPEFTQAGEMSTQLFAASAFRRTSPWYNLTVIAVRPGNRLYTSIDDMTMWVSAYSLVVFSVVLPTEFLVGIVPYLSFVSDMCPLGWQSALKSARTAMNHYVEPLLDQSEYVYLVGQGTIGASAAVVALQNEMRLKSILFSSPQIMSTMFGIDLTEVEMSEMLVSVLSTESAFASTQLHLPTTQTIPCTSSGGRFCDELNTMARQLFNMCNTWRPSPGPGLT